MKRVLLGIPTARHIDATCLAGVVETLFNSTVAEFQFKAVIGCYVNVNRNKIVDAAKDGGFDEVLMVDSDMAVTREHIERLLSHDVDIVGAVYCKRVMGEPQWTYHYDKGARPDERGLMPVNDIGAGVLRVRMNVFAEMERKYPWRRYQHRGCPVRHEYFPLGVPIDPRKFIVNDGDPLPALLGEDTYFCRNAKECGFQVWSDTNCCVGHIGEATYPLTP